MTKRLLPWIERGLWVAGASLAVWCAIVLARSQYYGRLSVPAAVTALPGESAERSRRPVERADWIARLEAPTVNLAATVLKGSDDATLARAAGHIEETALPGESGNIGIAGHRDTVFRPVRKLRVGDPLVLTTATGIFRYRIHKTTIVDPEDVYVLDPTDRPTLTLVTCYPFEFIGHAPRRYIVSADLVQRNER